jgi:hypothetical protein
MLPGAGGRPVAAQHLGPIPVHTAPISVAGGKHLRTPSGKQASGTGHDRSCGHCRAGAGTCACRVTRACRGASFRGGSWLGGVVCALSSPESSREPICSPESQASGIHERAGTGEVNGAPPGCTRSARLRRHRADVVTPPVTCQVRTPTGAAAHDRRDGPTLRFGQPPRWSGPDTGHHPGKPSNRT